MASRTRACFASSVEIDSLRNLVYTLCHERISLAQRCHLERLVGLHRQWTEGCTAICPMHGASNTVDSTIHALQTPYSLPYATCFRLLVRGG